MLARLVAAFPDFPGAASRQAGKFADPRTSGCPNVGPADNRRSVRAIGGSWSNPEQECRNVRNDASNAGSRGSFRPPDAVLESEDGRVHLRPAQQDPHRQPREDDAALPGGDEVHPPTGLEQGHGAVRRHQAPGARDRRRGSPPLRDAVRRRPLARRHADQLQDGQGVDQAPEGPRADARRTARSRR